MHRRPLGRGRVLAIVAALVMLVACLLPWFSIGGESDLPELTERAFDGVGILTFAAALLTIALVTLPYAAGQRPVAIDAWPSYLLIFVIGLAGVALWPLVGDHLLYPAGLLPGRAPGYWLAIVGVLIHARAVFEIHQRPITA
jgi:hypothetical protein